MQNILKVSALIALISLSGCSSMRFPGVFRIDVGQGNIITQDMVDKLSVGMTPRQVQFVMGSPMIKDPFHPNRWDYLFYVETGNGTRVENHVILHFSNERLAEIDMSRFKDPERVKQILINDRLNRDTPQIEVPTETEARGGL